MPLPPRTVPDKHLPTCVRHGFDGVAETVWHRQQEQWCRLSRSHTCMSLKHKTKSKEETIAWATLFACVMKLEDPRLRLKRPEDFPNLCWCDTASVFIRHCEPGFILHLLGPSDGSFRQPIDGQKEVQITVLQMYGARLLSVALGEKTTDPFVGSYSHILLRWLGLDSCRDVLLKMLRIHLDDICTFAERCVDRMYMRRAELVDMLLIGPAEHSCCRYDTDLRRVYILDLLRDVWTLVGKLPREVSRATYLTYFDLGLYLVGSEPREKDRFKRNWLKMRKKTEHVDYSHENGCLACGEYHVVTTAGMDSYLWRAVDRLAEDHLCKTARCAECRAHIKSLAGRSEHQCAYCGKGQAQVQCSICKVEQYCGRAHQKAAWKQGHQLCCVEGEESAKDFEAYPVCRCPQGTSILSVAGLHGSQEDVSSKEVVEDGSISSKPNCCA